MPSLHDVARAAGVSVATVSHVINSTRYVSPELTARVRRALADLNYYPNLVAKGLRTHRTQTIGFLTSDITNPFYPGVAKGASDVAAEHGYSVILRDVGEGKNSASEINFWLQQRQVDGLLFTSTHMDDEVIASLQYRGVPFVLINRRLREVRTNYVGIDNESGMLQAVQHLVNLGHEKIGFVCGIPTSTAGQARMNGFLKAARRYGLETGEDLMYQGHYLLEDGYDAVRHFLRVRPDISAIVAANDLMALGAWRCLAKLGVGVPDEVSIVGFDDVAPASMGPFGLTTVRCPQYEMGAAAARMLLEIFEEEHSVAPRHIVFPVHLIVRDTTGPRRKSAVITHINRNIIQKGTW